jgi:inner membrane protein
MDNLCHTLAGAALGEAGLKRKTALGMATLLIASNLPDVDVLVFATDILPMSFRRGWTHGVLAMAVLPAVLGGLMLLWHRLRRRSPDASARSDIASTPVNLGGLLLLGYCGTWLHVFMDFLNTYGVRLLMPFSNRWFYGDALYIIDPLLYLVFGGAVVAARIRRRRGRSARWQPARLGLAVAAVYVALMLASNLWARAEVARGLARAGRTEMRFMVTPVFANPIRREVIIDTGDRYEKGSLWFEPFPHFRPLGYGVDTNHTDPAVQDANRTPLFQAYLGWARFPFYVIERTAVQTRVHLHDYRYWGPSGFGWSSVAIDLEEPR